jgi:hypothetical protein
MTDVKQHLMEGDPLINEKEPGLTPAAASEMRRVVLAAVVERAPQPAAAWWPGPFVMAAAVAACLLVGISIGLRLNPVARGAAPGAGVQAATPDARRQLQFVTAGGTRIIWTFHENFEL